MTGCDWMKRRREKRDIMKLLVTSVHTNTAIFGDGVLKKIDLISITLCFCVCCPGLQLWLLMSIELK